MKAFELLDPESSFGLTQGEHKYRTEFVQCFLADHFPYFSSNFYRPSSLPSSTDPSVLYLNIAAKKEGQTELLYAISRFCAVRKLKWHFIRYYDFSPTIRVRICCNNSRKYFRTLQEIQDFLYLPSNRIFFSTHRVETFSFEKDVYNDEDAYHSIAAIDSHCVLKASKVARESEDRRKQILVSAWMSTFSFAKNIGLGNFPELRRTGISQKQMRMELNTARLEALLRMNNENDELARIYRSRDLKLAKSGHLEKISKMSEKDRKIWYSRLCHLSFNRLDFDILGPFEKSIMHQSLAVQMHLQGATSGEFSVSP